MAPMRRILGVGSVILAVISLLLASQVFAGPDRQSAVTPTAGFGPIITAQPAATPVPASSPTAQPTATLPLAAPTVTPLPTAGPSPTALPTLRASLMGIQLDPSTPSDAYDTALWLAKRLGVQWIKFQFAWKLLEPQQGQFSETFYAYRIMVQKANEQGFKVLISVAKAPAWARATADEDGPPTNPQDLASFLTRMMAEIRVDYVGNSYFNAIEVWNEPNLRREWNGGTISGAEYMRLFDAAYDGIRAGEGGSTVTIITAGLAPTGINDGVAAMDDRQYLNEMYQAGLANSSYQNIAIGTHPYGAANPPDTRCCANPSRGYDNDPTWFFLDTLNDYHDIMGQNGDTGRLLWATEFGWGTYEGFVASDGSPAIPPADPPYLSWLTQDQQANYTIGAFKIAQSLPWMGPMILWNLNYGNQAAIDQSDPKAAYALLRGGVDPLRPTFNFIEAAPKQ